ncbi:MAG: class B sortase [Oscillospiraceae bacterium]|nr:class B sortase [Oscillospiraceae bacterium]
MAAKKTKKHSNRTLWIIILILSLLLVSVSLGVYAWVYVEKTVDFSDYRKEPPATDPVVMGGNQTATGTGQTVDPTAPTAPTEPGQRPTEPVPQLRQNPIDFEGLQKLNEDIYAWIYIPHTDIDLPVFQAPPHKDDNFYMYHNVKGEYEFKGSIYSQRLNEKDFRDPVTVLYGHHMLDDSMFSNLHYFMDRQFFADNEYFYIYTPGHILTYRIVSAHEYDERHILNSYDFTKEELFRDYLDYILAPRTMVANVRENVTLNTNDRIVTLSTCTAGGSARYLVQGVLISDERTAS